MYAKWSFRHEIKAYYHFRRNESVPRFTVGYQILAGNVTHNHHKLRTTTDLSMLFLSSIGIEVTLKVFSYA